jgi:hypothetical protein
MENPYPHDFRDGYLRARCGHIWGSSGQCPPLYEAGGEA